MQRASHRAAKLPFVVVLVVSLNGCSRPESSSEDVAATGFRPNVLLISVDTLRPDHLGCYDYFRATSPGIDRLAQEGALFLNAVSSTSWTLPAHAALFTGLPDSVHGCTDSDHVLATERQTLAESMREQGYATAAFWSGPFLDPQFGLAQGFDDYIDCTNYQRGKTPRTASNPQEPPARGGKRQRQITRLSHEDITSPRILAGVSKWLQAPRKRPFFLFVHMWDVHHDYIPPPPYDSMFATAYSGPVDGRNIGSIKKPLSPLDLEHLVALYDGEIAWTDSHIGKLLDLLDENSLTDETLVIVTSDHGEEFFEHQKLGHRRTLFDESICIPLVMRCPRLIRPGLRISHQVSILDIAPTVLDLASLEPMNAMLGQSLVALIDGGDRPGSASVSELEHGRNSWIALRTLEWKLIVDRTSNEPVGLWDLQRDPAEQRSIYEGNAALRKRAEQALTTALQDLEELRERHPLQAAIDAQPLPAEIENQLRKLGYLDEDESER